MTVMCFPGNLHNSLVGAQSVDSCGGGGNENFSRMVHYACAPACTTRAHSHAHAHTEHKQYPTHTSAPLKCHTCTQMENLLCRQRRDQAVVSGSHMRVVIHRSKRNVCQGSRGSSRRPLRQLNSNGIGVINSYKIRVT